MMDMPPRKLATITGLLWIATFVTSIPAVLLYDPDRDVAAFVERIGPARWRMVIPRPAFESKTDVIELVPAS